MRCGRAHACLWMMCILVMARAVPAKAQSAVAEPEDPITFCTSPAMFPGVHVRDAQVALELWTLELQRHFELKAPMKLRIIERQDQIEAAIRAEAIDIVALTSMAFLDMRSRVELTPEFVPFLSGSTQETFVVLVAAGADSFSLGDLRRGPVLASALDRGRAAALWLDVLMLRAGLKDVGTQGLRFALKDRPAHAVLPVVFGQAAAAIVSESSFDLMCELNPQVRRDLRVAWRSPPLLTRVMCSRRTMDLQLRQDMRASALKMGRTVEGRQILDLLQTGPPVPFEAEMLGSLLSLSEERARLTGLDLP